VIMPENGVINKKFGVYKSLCCDSEIVIGEGLTFPDCPKHPNLPTKWKQVPDDRIPHVQEMFGTNKRSVA
jgi:hypothetical protein